MNSSSFGRIEQISDDISSLNAGSFIRKPIERIPILSGGTHAKNKLAQFDLFLDGRHYAGPWTNIASLCRRIVGEGRRAK
jgi:hypothetical protein